MKSLNAVVMLCLMPSLLNACTTLKSPDRTDHSVTLRDVTSVQNISPSDSILGVTAVFDIQSAKQGWKLEMVLENLEDKSISTFFISSGKIGGVLSEDEFKTPYAYSLKPGYYRVTKSEIVVPGGVIDGRKYFEHRVATDLHQNFPMLNLKPGGFLHFPEIKLKVTDAVDESALRNVSYKYKLTSRIPRLVVWKDFIGTMQNLRVFYFRKTEQGNYEARALESEIESLRTRNKALFSSTSLSY